MAIKFIYQLYHKSIMDKIDCIVEKVVNKKMGISYEQYLETFPSEDQDFDRTLVEEAILSVSRG